MKLKKSESPLIIGSTTIDFIEQNDRRFIKAGGVVNYAGFTFLKHGIPPAVLTNVNKADLQKFSLLNDPNVKLFYRDTPFTTNFINVIDGDKRRQRVPRRADSIGVTVGCDFSHYQHIHLGPLFPRDISAGLINAIPEDSFVSLDIQGYVRAVTASGQVRDRVSPRLAETLKKASAIKASDFELQLALDYFYHTPETLMDRFALNEVLVTTGPVGGYLYHRKGKITYTAEKVEKIVDTTGAGDVFFASFLYSKHYRNAGYQQALKFAAGITAQQVAGNFIREDELKLRIDGMPGGGQG